MASVCDGDGIEICTDGHSESMIDERELTTAGRDFIQPEFSPIRRSTSTSSRKKVRRFSAFSAAPVVAPELHELDLESTLVAGQSFLSSNPMSKSNCDEDNGISSSYMQAVTGGRLADTSSMHVHQVSILSA